MSKELAIMSCPQVGLRDTNYPVMWFSVKFGENLILGALIVMNWTDAKKFILQSGTTNIKDLDGKPCQVEVDKGTIKFIKVL